jgi:hypothetical protein
MLIFKHLNNFHILYIRYGYFIRGIHKGDTIGSTRRLIIYDLLYQYIKFEIKDHINLIMISKINFFKILSGEIVII